MKRIALLALLIFTAFAVNAQTVYTWVPAGGGVWTTPTNWSPNGVPTSGDDVIFNVAGASTITAVPTAALNNITIGGAGVVTLQGTAANVITINGIAQVNNGGIVNSTNMSFSFASGSAYNHNRNGGSVPTATWNAASNCNITGITTTNPTIPNQTYGNFTWNCAGQTSATGAAPNIFTVAGNLNVQAGVFADGGFVLITTATSQINVSDGATYRTTRTSGFFPTNFNTANLNLNNTGTWDYNGTTFTLPTLPTTYGGIVSISGSGTKTLGVNTSYRNLVVSAGTFALATFQANVSGNVTNSATITSTAATGKIQLTGGTAQHVVTGSAGTYSYLELNDTQGATFANTAGTTTVTNSLIVNSGTLTLNSFTTALTVSGTTVVSGTLTFNNATGTRNMGAITINSGGIVNVDVAQTTPLISCTGLNNAGTWNNTTVNSPVTLTTGNFVNSGTFNAGNGNHTFTTGTFTNTGTFNSGTGTYIFSAATSSINGNATTFASLTINSSTGTTNNITTGTGLTVSTTFAGSGTFIQGANSILTITAATVVPVLTANAAGNIVYYNSTSIDQTVRGGNTYANLRIDKLGRTANLGAATTAQNLQVLNGTFSDNSFQITGLAAGTLSVANGATLQIGTTATATTFPTLFTNANISLAAGSTVIYGSTGAQSISGVPTYSNLTLQGNSIKTSTAAVTVNGNLAVNAGTFADAGFQTVGNATGTLVVANGATLQFGAGVGNLSNFPTNFTTANITLNPTSTVHYNTTAATTISVTPGSYGNLTISGSSANARTMGGSKTVQGTLTINTGVTFGLSNFTLTVNGSINKGSTVAITGTGKILLSGGSTAHSITGGGSLGNIELDDAQGATVTTGFSILGVLTQTSGTLTIPAGQTLTLGAGSSLAATGTGDFGGTTTSNLTISGSGVLGNSIRFAPGAQNLGTLTLNRTTSGTTNLGSDLTLNAATGLTMTTTLLNLGNNNLTFASTSSHSIIGSATNMIIADATGGNTGRLLKVFPTATNTSFTFPIGDATTTVEYSPFVLTNFNPTGNTKTIGVNVIDDVHPQLTSNGAQPLYITRYWDITESGLATSYTYAATTSMLTWVAADVVGGTLTTANSQINLYNGGNWSQLTSTVSGATATTTTGNNNVSSPLGGSNFTMRLNPPQTYTWVATSGSADWQAPASWSPARNSPSVNDILVFSNGGSSTATNVPTQTIRSLTFSNNTSATLQTAVVGGTTLSINGPTATANLSVASGSSLQIGGGATTLTLTYVTTTGQLGTINGDLTVNANGAFTNVASNVVTVNGNLTFNGGAITIGGGIVISPTGAFNMAFNGGAIPTCTWNTGSTCNVTCTTTAPTSASLGQTFSNLTINTGSITTTLSSGTCTVNGTLTLQNGIFAITAGTLVLNGAAIAGTPTNLTTTTASTLTLGAAYAGTTLPTSITTIGTLNHNTTQNITLGASLTINTSLTKTATAGRTILGNFDLSFAAAATVSITTPTITNMIVADATGGNTGQVFKTFNTGANANFIFHIGDVTGIAEYSPVTIGALNATGGTKTIGVNVVDDEHPNLNSNLTQTNYINRYWQFTESGAATSYTYSAATLFQYATTDVVGTVNATNDQINHFDTGTSTWTPLNSTYTAGPPPSFNTALTNSSTSVPFGGNSFAIRKDAGRVYTWTATSGTGNWQTAGNWTPSRDVIATTDILQFANGGTPTANNIPTGQNISKLIITGNTNATLQNATASTLSINGNTATQNLDIDAGSTLNLGGGALLFTLNFATTTGQLAQIDGTLNVNGTGAFTTAVSGAAVTIGATGLVTTGGGTYTNSTSTTTTNNGTFTNTTGTFTNSGTYVNNGTHNHNGGTFTNNNSYTISASGIHNQNIAFSNGATIVLNGAYYQNVGALTAGTFTIGANSNFYHNLNGGTLPTITWTAGTNSTVHITSPTTGPTAGLGQTFNNLTFNNSGVTTTLTTGTCTVNGTLTMTNGTYAITAATLVLNGPNVAGNQANLTTTSASTLTFGGTTAGVTIPSGIANVGTLNLNNTQDIALSSNVTVNTSLVKPAAAGRTLLGNYNLILNTAATTSITTPTANNMIVADANLGSGQLMKIFPAATSTSFTFNIGDATGTAEYSPVVLTSFNPTGGTKTIGVKVTDDVHPEMNANATQTNYVERYWSFSESGPATSYTYAATTNMFTWVAADNIGTINATNCQINKYDNGALNWSQLVSTFPSATQASTSTAYNNVTGGLGNNDFTIRLNPPQPYVWLPTSGSADFNTPTNWNPVRSTPAVTDRLEFTSGGTSTAINVPSQTIAKMTVSNNTNITLQGSGLSTFQVNGTSGAANIDVDAGSTLQIASTSSSLSLVFFTTGNQQALIDGSFILNTGGAFLSNVSTCSVTVGTTGVITMNGGNYTTSTGTTTTLNGTFNQNSGTFTNNNSFIVTSTGNYNYGALAGGIPALTWNTGSTLNLVSPTTTPTIGYNQLFSNFNVNTGGPTAVINSPMTVNGILTLTSGTLSIGSSSLTLNGTVNTTGGALTSTTGTLTVAGTGGNITLPAIGTLTTLNLSRTAAATITMGGNITVTGTVTLLNSSNTLDINGNNLTVGQSISNSGTIIANGVGSTITLNTGNAHTIPGGFTAGTIYNLTVSKNVGTTVTLSSPITIANLLTLNTGTLNIAGGGTLTLAGQPIAGTPTNLTASASNTAGIVIAGTTAGHFLPSSLGSGFFGFLTVNNPNGVSLTSNIALNAPANALTLTDGNVILGPYNLTINNLAAAALPSGSATSYIEVDGTTTGGQLYRATSINTSYLYPIGTAANYSPATLTFGATNTISGRLVGTRVVDAAHPAVNTPTADTYINRYWRVTTTNNSGSYTYSASFNYAGATITGGAESTLKLSRHNGTVWNEDGGSSVNTGTDVLTSSLGLTQAAWDFNTVDFTARVMPMSYVSSTVVQQTGNLTAGTNDNPIIQIQVVTNGSGSPLSLNSLTFNTNGSTNPVTDLTAAKVYYTGLSSTFATGNQFGTTVTNPNGSHVVNGTQVLSGGTNYFWVAYNISATPTYGNDADAECTAINVSSTNYTPTITAPAGVRPIPVTGYCNFANGGIGACTFINDYGLGNLNIAGTTLFNTATCADITYFDGYGGTSVAVNQGESYSISLSRLGNSYTTYFHVYADWNNDADFNDAGELIFQSTLTSGLNSTGTISIPLSATIAAHRIRVVSTYTNNPNTSDCSSSQGTAYDFKLVVNAALPMTYVQTDVIQASTANVDYSATNWQILRLNVKTSGALNPLVLNTLDFNTAGTTTASDITLAKLWKNSSGSFSGATQIGTVNLPSGAFSFTGLNQTLAGGDNYYWLTYDISPCAYYTNVVDAQATGILIGSSTTTPPPAPSSPAGTRTIMSPPVTIYTQNWDANNTGWATPLTSVGPAPGPNDGYTTFNVNTACNYVGNGNGLTLRSLGQNCAYWADVYANIVSQSININTTGYIAGTGSLTFQYDVFQNGFDFGYDYSSFYYSTDGGTSWTLMENVFDTQGFVEVHTFSLPAAAFNITNLRFRVQWRNDNLFGQDPPFLLDNVKLIYQGNTHDNVPDLVVTNPPSVTAPATVDITVVPTVVTDNNNSVGTYTFYPTLADAQADTNPLATPTAIAISGTYYIKKTVTATGCTDIEPVVVTILPGGPLTWDGSVSTDWNDANNWTPAQVPTAANDIIVPDMPNDPFLSTGANGACKDVTISAGATVTIAAAKTIDVKGNWSGANNTVSGAGRLIFSATSPQSITGGATISNWQINNTNGVTVAGGANMVTITSALELVAGQVVTNGNITIRSTSTTQAYINDFSSGNTGTLSGNVRVERFITNGPNGYRYIGAPVATTAGGSTLALGAMTGFVISGTPGQLIPLANCSPTNSAMNSPYATFMRWEETGPFTMVPACRQQGWWFQTTGTMTIGRGYGAKLSGGNKVTYTGAANTGTISYSGCTHTNVFASAQNGWNLVANPYPSNIFISNTDAPTGNNMPTGFDGQVQFYMTSGPFTGTYVTYNAGLTTPPQLPIALGQGFWVRVSNPIASPGIAWTLTNAHRITTGATYYDANPNVQHNLKVEVAGNGFMDQTYINFKGDAQTGFDYYDANKWDSRSEQPTLYTSIGSEPASINSLPSLEETVVVPMGLKPGTAGNFTFTFGDIATFPQTAMIYLEDLQLGTMTDLRANNTYNFSMTTNDDANRFMLHFQPGLQAEVADQDCDNAGSIELTQPAPTVWPAYEVRGNDNNIYAQGTNFTGSLTIANLPAQEYVVTVTHPSGYSAQEYVTVNGSSPVNATINASATNVMIDEMVSLTATATNATEYVWNFGDGNTQSGLSSVVHAYDAAGTYNVTVTASGNVCEDVATKTIVVGNTTGINNTQANTVNIYGQGQHVVVEFNNWGGNKADIFMYNALGQRMESLTGISTLKGRQELNIANIVPGTYFIQVVSDGKIQGKKVFLGSTK